MRLTFKEKFINIEEGKICYYVCGNLGSRSCLIFLNGLYHGKEAWTKQQRNTAFHANFKMIFIDYRGSGNSDFMGNDFTFEDVISDIKKVFEAENSDKTFVIGYSIGGLFATYYSYLYPNDIERLILLNTGVSINIHASQMLYSLVHFINKGMPLKEVLKFILPWNYSEQYLEKVIDFEETVRENYSNYNKNVSAFLNLLKAIKHRPYLYSTLEKIKIPTLLIGGSKDYIFPTDFQKELHDKLSNSVLYILDNCGHASFIEKESEVNSIIFDFLTQEISSKKYIHLNARPHS